MFLYIIIFPAAFELIRSELIPKVTAVYFRSTYRYSPTIILVYCHPQLHLVGAFQSRRQQLIKKGSTHRYSPTGYGYVLINRISVGADLCVCPKSSIFILFREHTLSHSPPLSYTLIFPYLETSFRLDTYENFL